MKKHFYPVPQTGNITDWENIIAKLPEPEESDGMNFVERVILNTSSPNKKNKETGESHNVARNGGTGNRDKSLLGSFSQGIDAREMPPKVLFDGGQDYLYGGFGRSEIFAELKYNFWVYDRYEYDEEKRNHLQKDAADVLQDAAISDNGKPSSKPPSKNDYISILVNRITKYKWSKVEMKKWFDGINHCLTKDQISEYIKDAISREKALGRVEWLKTCVVEQQLKKECPEVTLLNTTNAETGNTQRFMRTLIPMMKSYIDTDGKTQEYCLWNSAAESHEEIDDSAKAMDKNMESIVELMLDFVDTYRAQLRKDKQHRPCKPTKRLTQKIGADKIVGKIVNYTNS
jgi:hypothetical protein